MNENEKTGTFAQQVDAALELKRIDLKMNENNLSAANRRSRVYSYAINVVLIITIMICITALLCNL